MEFFGKAKCTGGGVWYYEERRPDGSIKICPLQPYDYETSK